MDTVVVALRVVLSLAVVLGLLWVVQRRLTKGARISRNANLVTVVGRQGIGQKAAVVVVDIDGKRLVLGVTEQSVSVLMSDDAPIGMAGVARVPVAASASGADEFARLLGTATAGEERLEPPIALRPRRDRPSNRLGGSILSAATWQQTAAALRQRR